MAPHVLLYRRYDRDSSGFIDFDEFKNAVSALAARPGGGKASTSGVDEDRLQSAFDAVAGDDHLISLQEFAQSVSSPGLIHDLQQQHQSENRLDCSSVGARVQSFSIAQQRLLSELAYAAALRSTRRPVMVLACGVLVAV